MVKYRYGYLIDMLIILHCCVGFTRKIISATEKFSRYCFGNKKKTESMRIHLEVRMETFGGILQPIKRDCIAEITKQISSLISKPILKNTF